MTMEHLGGWVLHLVKEGRMAAPWAKRFYNSQSWLDCRAAFIAQRQAIDGGLCQHCGRRLGYIVDHVRELTPGTITDPVVSLNHENLQYLCTPCHNRKTFGTMPAVGFDSDGRPREI